jgi:hypothetical protein
MPKLKKKLKEAFKNDQGMGYVESLIALVVAGTACIALLSIASSVLREAANNEMRDAMTQYAVEGLEKVRRIADEDVASIPAVPASNDEIFVCLEEDEGCEVEGDEVRFHQLQNLCSDSDDGQGDCGRLKLRGSGEDLFYREISFRNAGTCSVEATVYVGLLQEGRGIKREAEVSGYIGGINNDACNF